MKNTELEIFLKQNAEEVFLSAVDFLSDWHEQDFSIRQGKVRDIFDLGGRLVIVTTDRISTFDVVHPNGVPGKGIILSQMSLRWLELLKDVVPNHLLSANIQEFPSPFCLEIFSGRTILVEKLEMVPIECVVRGNLAGSAWEEYQQKEGVGGLSLPPHLLESQQLKEPIFTPAIKSPTGHDMNISLNQMSNRIGQDLTEKLKQISLCIYDRAQKYALSRGIIIADTKFEFGLRKDGVIVLADEVLTPDSSRFWDAKHFQPGKAQPSFDKQPVRDWALSTGWDKTPPAPFLPSLIVEQTAQRYKEVYNRLFG